MLGRCIHFVYHFFDEIWVACQLCKFINRHPAKDNIAVVLVGHKFVDAWNVGASNQINQMLGSLLFIEQLAIKNRRAKRVWKAIAFIVGGIIAVYVLILILATVFTFSPNQSGTTDSSQSIESIVEKE